MTIKEILSAIAQLIFWTLCFVLVVWALTNAYVLAVVLLLAFVFCMIGIYGG